MGLPRPQVRIQDGQGPLVGQQHVPNGSQGHAPLEPEGVKGLRGHDLPGTGIDAQQPLAGAQQVAPVGRIEDELAYPVRHIQGEVRPPRFRHLVEAAAVL